MKTNKIIRRVDDLGRICIPREIMRDYGIKEGDQMEFCIAYGVIILSKRSDYEDYK